MSSPNYSAEEVAGKIQLQGEAVPDGGSEVQPGMHADYIKGGGQTVSSLDELLAFHPLKMEKGMPCSVVEVDDAGKIKVVDYRLLADPSIMYDPTDLSILVTEDNFLNYWAVSSEIISNFSRVYEYAPDAPNGAKPPYPYESNPAFEQYWEPEYDASKGHRWLRFRDDDVDDNEDDIFDNWTVPLSIGTSIAAGDYMENRYREWVENLNWDWCISRQRYFGVTFPVWTCDACGAIVTADEDELPLDPTERGPSHPCTCGSTTFTPDQDVMDTWATSSLSPQIVGQWLTNPTLYDKVYPFSLRPQA